MNGLPVEREVKRETDDSYDACFRVLIDIAQVQEDSSLRNCRKSKLEAKER